jgi:type II secretion system protein G
MTDHDLLHQYLNDHSQEAFAQLADRHVHWLYSTAVRLVHDAALAQDVTQAVFLVLVQKARSIPSSTPLAPWLFRVLRHVALSAIRSESRRRIHETEAAAMIPQTATLPEPSDWSELSPHLDEAVERLPIADRTAVLLRFYQKLSFPQLGTELGISEEAARKRVNRALDKLRSLLVTAQRQPDQALPAIAALDTVLLEKTSHSAPPVVIAAVLGVGAGIPVSTTVVALAKGVFTMLYPASLKIFAAIAACAVAGTLVGVAITQSQTNLPPEAQPAAAAAPAPAPIIALASEDQLRATIDQMAPLKTALDLFEIDLGRYPTAAEGLAALTARPAGMDAAWNGPYIEALPTDSWGRPFVYVHADANDPAHMDLASLGPDGIQGTADDIDSASLAALSPTGQTLMGGFGRAAINDAPDHNAGHPLSNTTADDGRRLASPARPSAHTPATPGI